jgi:hypothetical protein
VPADVGRAAAPAVSFTGDVDGLARLVGSSPGLMG